VVVNIDRSVQRMSVAVDGMPRYNWRVSTARRGYITPPGTYHPEMLARLTMPATRLENVKKWLTSLREAVEACCVHSRSPDIVASIDRCPAAPIHLGRNN
jgi:hypothetical protein